MQRLVVEGITNEQLRRFERAAEQENKSPQGLVRELMQRHLERFARIRGNGLDSVKRRR